jgi:beta-lactamase class A
LIQILESTTTGAARLKGLLPPDTLVAHKTGTTGTEQGFTAGTNDVGVITLPGNAGKVAIAVFIKGSASGSLLSRALLEQPTVGKSFSQP